MVVGTLALSQEPKIWGAIETLLGSGSEKQVHCVFPSDNKHYGVQTRALVRILILEGLHYSNRLFDNIYRISLNNCRDKYSFLKVRIFR